MLHGLEGPDGPVELTPLLGVGHTQVGYRPGDARQRGRGQGRGLQPPSGRDVGPGQRPGGGHSGKAVDGDEGIQRGGQGLGRGPQLPGLDHPGAVGVEDHHLVEGVEVLHHEGTGPHLQHPHHPVALGCPGHCAGHHVAGHQGPGYQGPAQLLEDEGGLGHPQAGAALGLRQAQGEDPRLGQLPPPGPFHTGGRRQLAHGRHREAALQQLAHAFLQILLVRGEVEVHRLRP